MQVQPQTNITLLRDLKAYRLTCRIRIRVSRIWRPISRKGEGYDGLHYILIDQTGDIIHGMIDEYSYEYVTKKMEEGKVYDIYKFNCKTDFLKCKVVNHEVKVHFNESTEFIPVNDTLPPIPRYGFRFLEFQEFFDSLNNQTVFADVYGCIKSVTAEHKVYVKEKKQMESLAEIVLQNLRREDLKISLWAEIARNFDVEAVKKLQSPVLAAITSLRVTTFQRQTIGSSTEHTCIIMNPHVQEEQEFRAEFSKSGDKVKMQFRQGASEGPKEANKTVSELYELDPADYVNQTVVSRASIKRYPTHNGWWYRACSHPNCFKQLKKQPDSDDLICAQHAVQNPLPCYRVCMTIEDDNNQATVTLMGKQAEQLFGYSCQDLLNKRLYQTEQDLPMEIEKTIGETHLFEIRITFNGELVIRSISQNLQISEGTSAIPTTATPQKTLERKRSMHTTGKALFISESEKRSKSQEKEISSSSSSSSADRDQYEKGKID